MIMDTLDRRNNDWTGCSRKRMIFMCWRHHTKVQKGFLFAIKNVLEKSMYKKGLDCINQASRDV